MFVDFENFNVLEEPYFVTIKKKAYSLNLFMSGLRLLFKVLFTRKYIKIIYLKKKIIFNIIHQNNIKISKKYYFKIKKILIFFKIEQLNLSGEAYLVEA
jgi:hypothetical protein